MATLDQNSKERLSELLERASSWVEGERKVALLAASKELLGADPEEANEQALEQLSVVYNPPPERSSALAEEEDNTPFEHVDSDPAQGQDEQD